MNNYLGISFIVPTTLGFIAFIIWMVVVSRMTNLRIQLRYRLAAMLGAMVILLISVQDISREHYYPDRIQSFWTVFLKTGTRAWYGILGLAFYSLIGKAYPLRMAASEKEKTPHASPMEVATEVNVVAGMMADTAAREVISAAAQASESVMTASKAAAVVLKRRADVVAEQLVKSAKETVTRHETVKTDEPGEVK